MTSTTAAQTKRLFAALLVFVSASAFASQDPVRPYSVEKAPIEPEVHQSIAERVHELIITSARPEWRRRVEESFATIRLSQNFWAELTHRRGEDGPFVGYLSYEYHDSGGDSKSSVDITVALRTQRSPWREEYNPYRYDVRRLPWYIQFDTAPGRINWTEENPDHHDALSVEEAKRHATTYLNGLLPEPYRAVLTED
ncbi:MAG: hypothetical protein ACOCX1_04505, partial [Fimbriimonadaceae bacterium]